MMHYPRLCLVALLLAAVLPKSHGQERKPSLLRGDKSTKRQGSSRQLMKQKDGTMGNMDMTMGGRKRTPRMSLAIKGQKGSLGMVSAKVAQGNENELKKATEEEVKKQLQAHMGGHGKEQVHATAADFDPQGHAHVRLTQTIHGMPVEGAALVVHVHPNGTLESLNGEICDDEDDEEDLLRALDRSDHMDPQTLLEMALEEAGIIQGEWVGEPERAVVRRDHGGSACLAWKQAVRFNVTEGSKGDGPQLDWIFADATYSAAESTSDMGGNEAIPNIFQHLFQNDSDALKFYAKAPHRVLCARHPQYMGSGIPNMKTYDCNGRTSFCSLESASSARINTGDDAVDAAHNGAIATYDYFFETFGRDSLDGQGMELISYVHYDRNYNNAFWDGRAITYGDGDGSLFRAFSLDVDVVAHELTHGLTSATSALVYSYESGALNEAMSDIFGAMVDRREGATGDDIWLVGEDIYTPGIPGDGLRNMANPTETGDYDYYPERYVGNGDNGGVHINSGIANLAFHLLVTGGRHPRGKTSVAVEGIGFEAAAAIFYWANVDCLTPSSNFEMARFCTAETFGGEYRLNVHQAWDAVGVPGGPPPPPVSLQDGVPLGGQSGNDKREYQLEPIFTGDVVTCSITATSGDPDLYLRFDEEPSVWPDWRDNACSSYTPTSQESCTTTPAEDPGTLFILVHAWESQPYSDMTVTCNIDRMVQPSVAPSTSPTASVSPSTMPSSTPTNSPTATASPTTETAPSDVPSLAPSAAPSQRPSDIPSTYPTKSPTRRPTSPPTLPPVEPPPPPPIGGGCFSGTTGVQVLGKGLTPMSRLEIGDHVLTMKDGSDNVYEPVYSFGHYHKTVPTEFVQIFYAQDQNDDHSLEPLEMTGNHLLYIVGKSHPIRADAVRANDMLRHQSNNTVTVKRTDTVTRNGLYAPLTPSGTIVVHGVGIVASTYISLQDTATEYIELQGGLVLTFLPQQKLCHLWMTPSRLWCLGSQSFLNAGTYCQGEYYNDKGRSLWVQIGKDLAFVVERQPLIVQILAIAAVLIGLASAIFIETCLAYPTRVWECLSAGAMVYYVLITFRRQKAGKKAKCE